MQRTKWRLLSWLLLYLVFHNVSSEGCNKERPLLPAVKQCMKYLSKMLETGDSQRIFMALEDVEKLLDEGVDEIPSTPLNRLVFSLLKPRDPSRGFRIHLSKKKVSASKFVNSTVNAQLPRELTAGLKKPIAFCLLSWRKSSMTPPGASGELYQNTLVGLKVSGQKVSGLRERVNITMGLHININETRVPRCVFYDFTKKDYSSDGCLTLWERAQNSVTCSCEHLTYFGVLMVSAPLSAQDHQILTYISQSGCGFSLIALLVTVLIFITNRTIRADVSMKVHINLVAALILLNLHFILSPTGAKYPSLCLYMALILHYSLLVSFSWMALEGFHVYLLLVKVFNIYIKKYLLKLALVGWGVPAIIVSLVVIIDRDAYGPVPLNLSNSNSTAMCYITNNTVKMVTTVGAFGLVFVFNLGMFVLAVRRIFTLHQRSDRTMQDICTVLGLSTLLGIAWGLALFSFGPLSVPGLYVFCILNSLQGVFILLWFVMFLRKNRKSASVTPTTSS